MTAPIQPVILAGGGGTRLWPLSTSDRPKHLLQLIGENSLLEATLERVADRSRFSAPLIICSAAQEQAIAGLSSDARLLIEPEGRNSGPAIAAAARFANPEAILLVLPSDHRIGDSQPLMQAVERARPLAEQAWLVTFGIRPSAPETGYGYITPGGTLADGVFEASRFVEKPDPDRASELIAEGSYWNAGMFLLQAKAVLAEFETHAPDIAEAVREAVPDDGRDTRIVRLDRAAFARSPNISFDHSVMERSSRVAVAPVDLDWSDLGTWASVYEVSNKDPDGNALDARTFAIDSLNCLLRSEGPQIIAVGVEDLVVVATPGHVLVVPRSEAQRVREAAALAANRGPA